MKTTEGIRLELALLDPRVARELLRTRDSDAEEFEASTLAVRPARLLLLPLELGEATATFLRALRRVRRLL